MGATLLKNGNIVDGTGRKSFPGNILITGDQIEDIIPGDVTHIEADTVIDISGKIVSPGFIDMHSHADWVLSRPDHDLVMKSYLEQGCTTIVGGNCGFSPAPFTKNSRSFFGSGHFELMTDRPLAYDWSTFTDFYKLLEEARPVINIAQQVGHATLRFAFARTRRGEMTPEELSSCLKGLRDSLEQGACGLSFGLGYDPGMYSSIEEIKSFCRIAREMGKPISVHIKALSRLSPTYPMTYIKPHNIRALKEIIKLARDLDLKLQISHLVFVGKRSWSTSEKSLEIIEEARNSGIDIMFDAFPYTFGNTTINAVIPYWFLSRIPESYSNTLMKIALKTQLSAGFALLGFDYNDFRLMNAACSQFHSYNGKLLVDIAKELKITPFELLLMLSRESSGKAIVLLEKYSGEPGFETVLESVLSHELCLFETDALIYYSGYPNPSAIGTFPRILGEFVRRRGLFSIEDAISRMTHRSAKRFGINDRGIIAPGKKADLVVFDPEKIDEGSHTGTDPQSRPSGIEHVFLNGSHVVRSGIYEKGMRAGSTIKT